ncbi:MAG: proton-conducting transporter membrane subunit [Pirellulaceae bacterium]
MHELHLPWLELAIVTPLIGAVVTLFAQSIDSKRQHAIGFSVLTLLFSLGAWEDFRLLMTFEAHDRWDLITRLIGPNIIVIDEFSAPLIPLTALIFLLNFLSLPNTKAERMLFSNTMLLQFTTLALLACRNEYGLVVLASVQTIFPLIELIYRRRAIGPYVFHMGLFVLLMISGVYLVFRDGAAEHANSLGIWLLIVAVLIRNGCAPLHCWLADLFENASFGTSLTFTTPLTGAYLALRLLIPISPAWALQTVMFASLATAVYAAALALVQSCPRRFFSYILLSHMSLAFVGLEVDTVIGLTGALCVWFSVGISLTGFGLTLRAVEARVGYLSLRKFHGLYRHVPLLATFFMLTGLSSIGFPGTIGFVGMELVTEGVVDVYPLVGAFVVVAAALNGMAILFGYFRIFTGTEHPATANMVAKTNEKLAVWISTVLIIAGGIWPQPGVYSRFHAASHLLGGETAEVNVDGH